MVSPNISDQLSFDIKSGIKTVYSFLKDRGALGLLEEEGITLATKEIFDGSQGKYHTQQVIFRSNYSQVMFVLIYLGN